MKANNGSDNYILINKKKKEVTYIVNNDKASNYKVYKKHPELSFIKIESQELADFIIDSFIRYPRTFLFENPGTGESLEECYSEKIERHNRITSDQFPNHALSFYHSSPQTTPKAQRQKAIGFQDEAFC